MSELIISVSGLRGIVGETLTPRVALDYAAAFAAELPPGPILVARDGRASGRMLMQTIEAALCALGRPVLRGDVMATPTVGVMVRQLHAAGALQISASHNPVPYNGIKLFGGDGRVLPAAAGAAVADRYRAGGKPAWVGSEELGTVQAVEDTTTAHLTAILATVNVERIRACRFPVLLDSNHGAGSVLGRRLLEALGCTVTVLGGEPDGQFAHPPEPTEQNLAEVGREITARSAAAGFCQDPDADRLALIDEQGRYVGEEYTLALCVSHRLAQARGPIVINCATSRMSQDVAERYGVPLLRSAVGEANVADEMLAQQALFGGEGNGGPIDPRVGFVRDSFVGMALILDALAERRLTLSALAAELPTYAIHKTKTDLQNERLPAVWNALERHFRDAAASRQDGLRLDWRDRWLLVRGSNTEPIVRVIAEAATESAARGLCAEALEVIAATG